jgi:hypothetical protein
MKRLSVYSFALLLLTFWGCEERADLVRTFIIRKGEHYSTPRIVETLQTNELVFTARFNETAVYHHTEAGFQDSKNKLMGFSDCNSVHHQNSARFGWQWYNEQLEIFAYCYVDGERVEEFVGVVELNEFNKYTISLRENAYVFRLNDNPPVMIQRGNVCTKGVYYKLWPYFGGSLPAPHDVLIEMKSD